MLDKRIKKVLNTLHEFFKDEDKRYVEYEDSDMEYFIGCMLYNHFNFTNALSTMKTIDVSYDFLVACGDVFDGVQNEIKTILIDNEKEKLDFLQNYLEDVISKYTLDELYLLNRLKYHTEGVRQRYEGTQEEKKIDFIAPKLRSKNPLLR
ncbi:MAG: hypothetical protein L3I99_01690 [Sulfurimonas sp.]|nr:hypothetical protein [Sulfurimonas sp.]